MFASLLSFAASSTLSSAIETSGLISTIKKVKQKKNEWWIDGIVPKENNYWWCPLIKSKKNKFVCRVFSPAGLLVSEDFCLFRPVSLEVDEFRRCKRWCQWGERWKKWCTYARKAIQLNLLQLLIYSLMLEDFVSDEAVQVTETHFLSLLILSFLFPLFFWQGNWMECISLPQT